MNQNPAAKDATGKEVVLVTGGTGFIGSAIAARLAERYTVVILDRNGGSDAAGESETIAFDLGYSSLARLRGEGTRRARRGSFALRQPHRLGHSSGRLLRRIG